MIIQLNDKQYRLEGEQQQKLIDALFLEALKQYEKVSPKFQILGDQVCRGLLYSAEKKMLANGASPENAALVRPAKKQSPTLKFLELIANNVKEPADHVVLWISETGGQINNVSYEMRSPDGTRL
jgi:hypothetical protein